jgi:hypothetical protein
MVPAVVAIDPSDRKGHRRTSNDRPAEASSDPMYRLMMFSPGGPVASVGGVLSLFAGVATLAWVAIAGVRGTRDWTRPALAAVTIAWSLTWVGTLFSVSGSLPPLRMGYWVLLVSVGVIAIGTIMVWVSARADAPKPYARAA